MGEGMGVARWIGWWFRRMVGRRDKHLGRWLDSPMEVGSWLGLALSFYSVVWHEQWVLDVGWMVGSCSRCLDQWYTKNLGR